MTGTGRREEWLQRLAAMTPEERDTHLFFTIDNLFYEETEDLLKAGARLFRNDPGMDMFSWTLLRTEDFRIVNMLLNHGLTAEHVAFKDLFSFFYEDTSETYKLLYRMAQRGLPYDERIAAVADTARKQAVPNPAFLEAHLTKMLRPGEDIAIAVNAMRSGLIARHPFFAHPLAVQADIQSLSAVYFAKGMTLQRLQETVDAQGMTGWMLAVRAGRIAEAISVYTQMKTAPDPQDFLEKDAFGQSVAALAAARGQLQDLLTPDLWRAQPQSAQYLLNNLSKNERSHIDTAKTMRDILQACLKDKAARPRGFKPKPE